jgi:molybdopterin-guanine dinucleotide biosynthesis protein A
LKDPYLVFVGLFRVDGIPVVVKCKDRWKILRIAEWLKKHIENSLEKIVAEKLDNISAQISELHVKVVPVSRTLAVVLVAEDETILYKFDMDIESLKELFRSEGKQCTSTLSTRTTIK